MCVCIYIYIYTYIHVCVCVCVCVCVQHTFPFYLAILEIVKDKAAGQPKIIANAHFLTLID